MNTVLLWIYYAFRALEVLRDRISGRLQEAYLKRKAASCGRVMVSGPGRFACVSGLHLGDMVGINANAYWVCEGGLTIGDNCRFARDVKIYTRNHDYNGSCLPYDDHNIMRPVTIGNNVWVGIGVTILPGTTIGDGAIIGAGAVVHGNIPPLAIIGAAPARPLKERDRAHYEACLRDGRLADFHGRSRTATQQP